jgi:hypothetical protein
MANPHRRAKQSYRALLALVASAINDWDPHNLIATGSPDNEFSDEVARIAAGVDRVQSQEQLARLVSSVFSTSFQPAGFSPEACAPFSTELFAKLRAGGFLRTHDA